MKPLFLGLLLLSGLAATAQNAPAPSFTSSCQSSGADAAIYAEGRDHSFNRQKLACETRDLTMPAPAGQPLTIEAGSNGSIAVKGWDGPDVRIRATVKAWADTEAAAQARVAASRISTTNNLLHASVPSEGQPTAVSYEVFVPRRTALALTTHNGSISLAGVQAAILFSAQNGSVSLADLGGKVTGKTINGSLSITLSGNQWEGEGLDIATVNGSIKWQVPNGYSAQLSTGTTNGSLRTTLPQSGPQAHKHEVKTALGQGGPLVQAVTINGSVLIKQG